MGEAVTETATRQVISVLRYQFDHVVLDCGGRLDDVLAMALDSADRVLIVATPDTPAVRSVRRLTDALHRLGIAHGRSMGLIVNRSGRRREIQPRTAAKMAAVPLIVSIPDLTTRMEMTVNSNALLTTEVPPLAKAVRSITGTILAERAGVSTSRSSPRRRRGGKGRHWRERSDEGQVTVEFPVVFALATAALLLCVQLLGYGISSMLANNAAEEAARDYGIGMSAEEVRRDVADHLPDAYDSSMTITRHPDDTVTVALPVPSVVELRTSAEAGIVREGRS